MKKNQNLSFYPKNATWDQMDSPVGVLTIITSPAGLHAILWDHDSVVLPKDCIQNKNEKTLCETQKQLQEYFEGKRKTFDLPLAMTGTPFQQQAWNQLQKIPYGTTLTYGEQAEKIGNKNKARAVGLANGMNPVSIVVPCHRVIGSNGKLTGFAGGLDRKAFLLEWEKSNHASSAYARG